MDTEKSSRTTFRGEAAWETQQHTARQQHCRRSSSGSLLRALLSAKPNPLLVTILIKRRFKTLVFRKLRGLSRKLVFFRPGQMPRALIATGVDCHRRWAIYFYSSQQLVALGAALKFVLFTARKNREKHDGLS